MVKKENQKAKHEEIITGLDAEVMAVVGAICSKYKDPSALVCLGDAKGCVVTKNLTSTGSLCIDRAVGVMAKDENGNILHGIPRGRIVEIMGWEGCGKTSLLNHMIAETQKQGKLAAIIDVEQTWDKNYAANIGVDVDRLIFSQPSYAEQALDILDSLIKTGKFGIICLDSVAALCPKAELEGNVGDNSIGVVAKLMSQMLRKISSAVNKTDTLVVFTNQYRDKIGVMYGSSQTTTGGNGLRYYSSVRIEMSKIGLLKDSSGDVIGNRSKVKIQKNKVAAPFKSCEFDILYGIGIDRMGEIVDLACDFGIMKKKGAWIEYSGNNIGQGRMATANTLRENSALCNAITNEILEKMYLEIYGNDEDVKEDEEEIVPSVSEE